jgi:heat shock protein 1/8
VQSKNALESYSYSLKSTLSENGDKFDAADKETLQTKVDEVIAALDTMESASKEEFESMQKELEQVANPIMQVSSFPSFFTPLFFPRLRLFLN